MSRNVFFFFVFLPASRLAGAKVTILFILASKKQLIFKININC